MRFAAVKEPEDMGYPHEHCCFCRTPTRFWCAEKDVACCEACASTHELADVPTKAQWFAAERSRR